MPPKTRARTVPAMSMTSTQNETGLPSVRQLRTVNGRQRTYVVRSPAVIKQQQLELRKDKAHEVLTKAKNQKEVDKKTSDKLLNELYSIERQLEDEPNMPRSQRKALERKQRNNENTLDKLSSEEYQRKRKLEATKAQTDFNRRADALARHLKQRVITTEMRVSEQTGPIQRAEGVFHIAENLQLIFNGEQIHDEFTATRKSTRPIKPIVTRTQKILNEKVKKGTLARMPTRDEVVALSVVVDGIHKEVKSYLNANMRDNDFARIELGGGEGALVRKHQVTIEFLTNIMASVIQSAREHDNFNGIPIGITILRNTAGGARLKTAPAKDKFVKAQSRFEVKNKNDQLCLLYALHHCSLHNELYNAGKDAEKAKKLAYTIRENQRQNNQGIPHTHSFAKAILEIVEQLNKDPEVMKRRGRKFSTQEKLTAEDLPILEKYFKAYIHIYDFDHGQLQTSTTLTKDKEITEKHTFTKTATYKKHLYIEWRKNDEHFNGITKYSTYRLNRSEERWCHVCSKVVDNDHACPYAVSHPCRHCKSKENHDAERAEMTKSTPWIKCDECNYKFPTQSCIAAHVCGTRVCCDLCGRIFTAFQMKKHDCTKAKCGNCGKQYGIDEEHKCYLQKPKVAEPVPLDKIYFADYETQPLQDISRLSKRKRWHHVVHFAVIKRFRETEAGDFEVDESVEFEGESALYESTRYLMDQERDGAHVYFHNGSGYDFGFLFNELVRQDKHVQLTRVGSKAKAMQACPKNPSTQRPLNSPLVQFSDSLLHWMCPLKSVPGMFGFADTVVKGDFPHRFIVEGDDQIDTMNKTLNYVGPPPPLEDYEPNRKSSKDRAALIEWYKTDVAPLTSWSYRENMRKYCHADVEVLGRGWLLYRKSMMELTGANGDIALDPTNYTTAASLAIAEFLINHMAEDEIGYFSQHGARVNSSMLEDDWLNSLGIPNLKRGHRIKLRNADTRVIGRDHRMTKGYVVVDAYDEATNTVFEFLGAYWHGGCNKCKAHFSDSEQKRGMTKMRTELLESLGYNVISICECTYDPTDAYKSRAPESRPFHPRDPFYGGRTEAFKHLVTLLENDEVDQAIADGSIEKLLRSKARPGVPHDNELYDNLLVYLDVTSLYPWVQKYKPFPLGHPEILYASDITWKRGDPFTTGIVGEDGTDTVYKGLMRVRVRAPRNLLIPVLPVRMQVGKFSKLVFTCCEHCTRGSVKSICHHTLEERVNATCQHTTLERGECIHSDDERSFVTDTNHVELLNALNHGYELLDIYNVHHFSRWRKGIFASYVNKFLKSKTEFGVTKNVSLEKRHELAKGFLEREGIVLDVDAMCDNPGRKAGSKLLLNSNWGKLGQNSDQKRTEIVTSSQELNNLVQREIQGQIMNVNYEPIENGGITKGWAVSYGSPSVQQVELKTANVYYACYTTAYARTKLYTAFDAVGHENVAYCDTDSVICKLVRTRQELEDAGMEISDYLGDWKNESADKATAGAMYALVAGGPKSYSHRTVQRIDKNDQYSEDTTTWKKICPMKMKGFSLNWANAQKFTHEVFESIVANRDDETKNFIVLEDQLNIAKDRSMNVYHEYGTKRYECSKDSRKRVIVNDGLSIPYGFGG